MQHTYHEYKNATIGCTKIRLDLKIAQDRFDNNLS